MLVGVVDGALDLVLQSLFAGQLGQLRELDAVLTGPSRSDFAVQHHQRRHERPAVPDHAGLPHQRVSLQEVLQVGR